MELQEVQELLKRYRSGQCSAGEKAMLESWYNDQVKDQQQPIRSVNFEATQEEVWQRILKITGPAVLPKTRRSYYKWPAVAAAVLLCLSLSLYFFTGKKYQETNQITQYPDAGAIQPGANKAYLTLANGKKISLTDAKNGQLASLPGIEVTKTSDGQLIYKVTENPATNLAVAYNTIETPRGGQYQVLLPDGSKVYLNAASSLKYPVNFSSLKERRVELRGEAYFEVVHNPSLPFKVNTGRQIVEVLGTHFNISSYTDEPAIKTTLVSGSVKITDGAETALLKPGQQAIVAAKGPITVNNGVDLEEVTSWKNGMFQFNQADLKAVMRQISRWYDVDVTFEGKVPLDHFYGKVPRNAKIAEVLGILEASGINFKIEGKRIIVK